MNATVIDTLRFADRLKDAGVEPLQAEAMSRAFNDELTEGVATKQDLRNGVAELTGEIARVDAKLDAMGARMDARFDAMDAKFDAMDAKFNALSGQFGAQSRHVFLVLALVAALGLYNAVAPHVIGKQPGAVATAQPAPSS